jgi:hypothetical protein
MSTLGDFRQLDYNGDAKRMFVVAESALAVDEDSVSSEWTTESEDGEPAPSNFDNKQAPKEGSLAAKAKKKRIKKWRVKQSLAKHRHLCEASDSCRSSSTSGSSSSTSTTSSASESAQEDNVPKCSKRQVRNDRRVQSVAHMLDMQEYRRQQVQGALQWVHGSKPHRHLALAPAFLSKEDIEALHRAAKHSSVKEINDRKGYLAFKHRVVRFEMQLRALYPELYARLMALMREADKQVWQKLRKKKNRVYPEIEYIEYDVEHENGDCYIEPHVDNKSGVTLVAMLSPSCDYVGGHSCFRRGSGIEGHRQTRLELGDIVMFRGEKLLHWITNVTSGRRVILQIELSRT